MNWDFFQKRVCLTADYSEWHKAQSEFAGVNLSVEQYFAVKEIGPHQSFSHSERNILLEFLHSDHETMLHLEDDCVFRDLSNLEHAINELPEFWDILYLGANLVCWDNGEPQPEKFSQHLWRVRAAWTTHAIAYNKRCVRTILEKQPEFSVQMYDNYLGERLPELNAYVVAPMVAYQRPHKSLIWQKNDIDDYTDIFEASDSKLK